MTEADYRPARLTPEQLERLRHAERELGVVLVAYEQPRGVEPAAAEARHGAEASEPAPSMH